MEHFFKKIIFSKEQIEDKCKELANWVNKEYKNEKDLIIIGLLKGSMCFLAQLIKDINVIHKLDFMTISSFDGSTKSSGNLKIIMDLKMDIHNKNVLIVEDIVDSGLTFSKVLTNLKMRNPKSIKTLVLLYKKTEKKINFKIDKFGFYAPNEFLVGFGLDIKEKLRNIPYIGIFDLTKVDEI